MRYDIYLLFAFVAIGLTFRKLSWKGWFVVALMVAGWMSLNLVKRV